MHVVYTAAHGGFAAQKVPLGGGGAVCDQLVAEWTRTKPFDGLHLLTPATVLGGGSPSGRDLVGYSERQYASFCRDFERSCTERILADHDPASTAVLVNDVSEGPDFQRLAQGGFRIYTIYHVDVVAYIADIYAKGWVSAKTLARAYEYLHWATPDIAKLVFQKQKDSVLFSQRCIVPSQRVKSVMRDCYPQRSAEDFVTVVPWGTWAQDPDEAAVAREMEGLRREYGIDQHTSVVLTLSRISPEKGQDQLLAALREYPDALTVFICGDAAFMHGRRHLDKLRQMAAVLPSHVRVHFPGHVTGLRKQAFFRLADLYVFPSRHESYGLTLLEALQAGLPAVCLDHQGARDIVQDTFGRIVSSGQLSSTIHQLLTGDPAQLQQMRVAARAFAAANPFSDAARRIAEIVRQKA